MEKGYRYARSECPICGETVADNWFIRHLNKEHPSNLNDELTPSLCIICGEEPVMDRPRAKLCSICFVKRIAELLDNSGVGSHHLNWWCGQGTLVRTWLRKPIEEYEELKKKCTS